MQQNTRRDLPNVFDFSYYPVYFVLQARIPAKAMGITAFKHDTYIILALPI